MIKSPWSLAEESYVFDSYPKGVPMDEMAEHLGRTKTAVRLKAQSMGLSWASHKPRSGFTVTTKIPTPHRSLDEIFADQAERFARKVDRFDIKRSGIQIDIEGSGPFGLLCFGDPHADDDGCDLERLAHDIQVVRDTPEVFGACIGDLTNNWIRALGHLYAHQGTTDDEATELLRWLVSAIPWMFVILGNHDKWSPLAQLICEERGVSHVSHGAVFKIVREGRTLTIDARHDHRGHSMYNPAHGQLKRNYRGSNADVIIGGHTHQSAYTMTKNGVTGQIGHSVRVGAYKKADEYADMLGLDDACISPSVLIVCDPAAQPSGFVHVFHDIDAGVQFLNAIREVRA